MKRLLFCISVIISTFSFSQNQGTAISIIPQPASMQVGKGSFIIKPSSSIIIDSNDSAIATIASQLQTKLNTVTGYPFAVKNASKHSAGNIHFKLSADSSIGKEGYRLIVSSTEITITAYQPAGLFYGMQTLLQLFPKEIENKKVVNNITWGVPVVSITDKPRFGWRGLLFDVTRHFFTKEEVKDFIDNMVRYKYNLLHLHLTDDQGWRIQIKSLPKLTEVGAWRPIREGKWGNVPAIRDTTEPLTYGGFYTHEDIRELVKYAGERFVNILPEVDVPGHSMAALASYPELSCTPGNYYVNAGEKFMQWHGNGKFSALVDNNLCPSKEIVYQFLDSVFTEVAMLFPFQYIHMGGDEAAKNLWEKSDTLKSFMQSQNLKDYEEVQSYFVKRVEQIIKSKGKKMIGWDEILEGGLAPEATVMSWRGMKGGIEAAKQNHPVVMVPSDFAYLDLMQGDKITEPYVYSTVRFSKTYKFDPVPEGINPALILGGQGNLWTEQIPSMRAAQYMLWPRALAVAESVWTPKEKKNYENFITRVENEFERMDIRKVKYAKTMYEPIFTATLEKDQVKVRLETEVPNLDIYYSFDETNPDEFYPKYKSAMLIPKDALTLKVITYRNGQPIGRQINMPVTELEKRAGKK